MTDQLPQFSSCRSPWRLRALMGLLGVLRVSLLGLSLRSQRLCGHLAVQLQLVCETNEDELGPRGSLLLPCYNPHGGERGPVILVAFKAIDPTLREPDGEFDSHTLPPTMCYEVRRTPD